MLLPRRIKLLLAATLAASSLTLVIAAYSSSGAKTESHAVRPTLKSKILRRKDRLNEKPNAYEFALLRKQATVQEERQIEDAVPKHVPLKIKLKREKEMKFKDLTNPDWMRDFELQVSNTSNKPIYFLELWLELPDTKSESGYPLMVPLRYGRAAFIDFDTRAIREDVPIAPGETHTFTIEEKYQRGWQRGKARTRISDPRKVKFVFVQLSFGDGSGFNGTGAEAYPYNRKLSSSAYCREGAEQIARLPSIRSGPFPSSHVDRWSESTPALIMPANFFSLMLNIVHANLRRPTLTAPEPIVFSQNRAPISALVKAMLAPMN